MAEAGSDLAPSAPGQFPFFSIGLPRCRSRALALSQCSSLRCDFKPAPFQLANEEGRPTATAPVHVNLLPISVLRLLFCARPILLLGPSVLFRCCSASDLVCWPSRVRSSHPGARPGSSLYQVQHRQTMSQASVFIPLRFRF
jgi:hypothetical protein